MRNTTQVLLVDDNPADSDLTSDVIRRCYSAVRISVAADGTEAMAFLRREGKYAEVPVAELVLLDLNLPGKDGRAVLAELKADPLLNKTPVIIFSTSRDRKDILNSYSLGANSYVTKPGNLPDFISAVTSIGNFWFSHAQLPPQEKR
ncbi:MAG: response regulator [Acidobacteriota bacterium]|nr:response regulator [Acidobacteriota bacterium]